MREQHACWRQSRRRTPRHARRHQLNATKPLRPDFSAVAPPAPGCRSLVGDLMRENSPPRVPEAPREVTLTPNDLLAANSAADASRDTAACRMQAAATWRCDAPSNLHTTGTHWSMVAVPSSAAVPPTPTIAGYCSLREVLPAHRCPAYAERRSGRHQQRRATNSAARQRTLIMPSRIADAVARDHKVSRTHEAAQVAVNSARRVPALAADYGGAEHARRAMQLPITPITPRARVLNAAGTAATPHEDVAGRAGTMPARPRKYTAAAALISHNGERHR